MSEPSRGPRYGRPNFDFFQQMASTPSAEDGPVFMINLMKYREIADYPGNPGSGLTGRQADDLYTPLEILSSIGAEIVFAADVERQLLGDVPKWDRVGIVKYPSRAAFLEMQTRPDFQARHVHKDAGMEQTIVLAGEPMHLPHFPELPPFELPAGDQPFVMMHVMKFGEAGRDALAGYSASAGAAGLALGVRPEAFFKVEGTVVGDGRTWDEVRFNRFPSHAVFDALRANETHRSGQPTRTAALQDTYTMMLLPIIDRLSESTRVELERSHQ